MWQNDSRFISPSDIANTRDALTLRPGAGQKNSQPALRRLAVFLKG
jgi:hypothetical protein